MSLKRSVLVVVFALALVSVLSAQVSRVTGNIRGIITDTGGSPLPGANVSAESPALMGKTASVTDADGAYRLFNLPLGTYTLTVSLQGFQTVKKPGIVVQLGQTFTINLQIAASPVSEEVTVVGAAPAIDVQSNKISTVISTQLVENLPIQRNIARLFNITAGSISDPTGPYTGAVHGANTGSTAYELDGVNAESPTTGGMQNRPQFDSVEEIEIVTGGLPAQVGASGGSFIAVVTKSGGNQFHGQAQGYYTAKGLNQMLFTDDELGAFGVSKPAFSKYDWTSSASLGGPIIKDKLWFYATLEYARSEYTLNYMPFTVGDTTFAAYTNPAKIQYPFIKLTTQLNKDMRLFVMFNGQFRHNLAEGGWGRALESVYNYSGKTRAISAELSWTLSADTFINFRGGVNDYYAAYQSQPETRSGINIQDQYTGYQWGNTPNEEQYTTRRGTSGSARLTHFMDGVLGGDHELGVGVEYVYMFDRLTVARGNPLSMRYWNGNPYFYAAQPEWDRVTMGDGLIYLANQGPNKGDSTKDLPGTRLSAYLQDSFTFKKRLTINLGARFDWYTGGFGGGRSTGTATDGLAYNVGEYVAETIGWNPFAENKWDPISKTMDYKIISPRIGVSYDLFGNGKTALKAYFGRFYEAMPVMWVCMAQAAIQENWGFRWWDDNANGVCDFVGTDRYEPESDYWQFASPDEESRKQQVAGPGDPYRLKPPYNNEYIVSVSHELARNLSVKMQYVHKRVWRDHSATYYDTVSKTYLMDAPGLWVPFTCTVPAYGDYPAQEVTVYYPKNEWWDNGIPVWKQFSSPYSKRLYNGIELTADKRYANSWALGGSITFSKSKSTVDTEWGMLDGNNMHLYGADQYDVPLVITLYGTFKLPFQFLASFMYRHEEGYPIDNGLNVKAPNSWFVANDCAVWYRDWWMDWARLDTLGTHRTASSDNVDLRLEKDFKFGFGTISVFADAFNLLGRRNVSIGQIPGGAWWSAGENTDLGTREVDYYYRRVTSVSGLRTFRISARVTF
jgi:hypothetical protein